VVQNIIVFCFRPRMLLSLFFASSSLDSVLDAESSCQAVDASPQLCRFLIPSTLHWQIPLSLLHRNHQRTLSHYYDGLMEKMRGHTNPLADDVRGVFKGTGLAFALASRSEPYCSHNVHSDSLLMAHVACTIYVQ
jgi:hypothetical protein